MIIRLWSPLDGTAPPLEPWPAIALQALASGTGAQSGLRAFHDDRGLSIGLWAAEPFTTHLMPYPVHEFMLVHEGMITIEDSAGAVRSFGPGEAFFIPKGFLCRWRQDAQVFKTFVIYHGTEESVVQGADLLRVDTTVPLAPLPPLAADVLASEVQPTLEGTTLYTDATGAFRLGLWSSSAFATHPVPYPYQEAMFILDGGMEWETDETRVHPGRGEYIFVEDKTTVRIRTPDHARKIFVSLAKSA